MVGRTIGHYQFLEKLGAGGMGEVYKAQDTNLGRFVAVKVLPSTRSGDPEHRRRFRQEAQAASALNHPNIITIYDMVSADDNEYIVMEYLAGKSLDEVIPEGGLRVPQALKYAVQIADALTAAHAAGIVHRDLKPANIRVTDSGLVKVLDFGLAKLLGRGSSVAPSDDSETVSDATALTMEGSIVGTVRYMSPEQAEGKKVDARSDIFSFGAVFYEMLTGRRAFEGESGLSTLSAILRDEVKSMLEIAPDVPAQLENVVRQCLKKNPEDRWQKMRDVHAALAALVRESESGMLYGGRAAAPAAAAPAAAVKASSDSGATQIPVAAKKSSGPMIGVAAALLVAAAGGGFWYMRQQGESKATPEAAPPAAAQTAKTESAPAPVAEKPAPPAEETVNNDSVLDLVKGKVPTAVILDQIRTAKNTKFDLSSAELIRLSKGGVTQAIIEQMREPHRVPQAAPPAMAKATPAAGAPASPVASAAAPAAPAPVTPAPVVAPPAAPASPAAAASDVNRVAVAAPRAAQANQPKRAAVPVAVADAASFRMSLSADIPLGAPQGTPLHFTAAEDLRVGDTVVVAKGTEIVGEISEVPKKGGGKLSFTVSKVPAAGGAELKVRMRRENDGGPNKRVLDPTKTGNATAAAIQGSKFAAFVDGPQTISVQR